MILLLTVVRLHVLIGHDEAALLGGAIRDRRVRSVLRCKFFEEASEHILLGDTGR